MNRKIMAVCLPLLLVCSTTCMSQIFLGSTRREIEKDPDFIHETPKVAVSKWGDYCKILHYHFESQDVEFILDSNEVCFMAIYYANDVYQSSQYKRTLEHDYVKDYRTGEWIGKARWLSDKKVRAFMAEDQIAGKVYVKYWVSK